MACFTLYSGTAPPFQFSKTKKGHYSGSCLLFNQKVCIWLWNMEQNPTHPLHVGTNDPSTKIHKTYCGPKVQLFVSAPISFVSAPISLVSALISLLSAPVFLSRHPFSFLGTHFLRGDVKIHRLQLPYSAASCSQLT